MMFPRTIKNSLTKKVLSVSLIGCITVTITAAAMQPFLVYASVGSGTLRGVLIGLSALMGTGNVNAASVNTLNSSAYVSDISAYSSANMSESDFNAILSSDTGIARWIAPMSNNAQQVPLAQEYVSAAGGDPSSLQGLGAASAAKNIQASIDYYLEHGELKPSFGGQTITDNIMGAAVMQSMADVAYNFDNVMWYAREHNWTDEQIDALFDSGAAFGDLQGAIDYINDLDKTIVNGVDVNTSENAINTFKSEYYISLFTNYQNLLTYLEIPTDVRLFYWGDGGSNHAYEYGFVNRASTSLLVYRKLVSTGETWNGNIDLSARQIMRGAERFLTLPISAIRCSDDTEFYTLANEWLNGTNDFDLNIKSPDIVTNDGQAKGTWTQDENANNRDQFNLDININYNPNYNYTIPDDSVVDTSIENMQDAVEGKQEAEDQLQQAINNNSSQETINNIQEIINNYEQTIINNFNYIIENMQTQNVVPQPTEAPQPTVIPPQPTEAPKPTNTPEQEQQNQSVMATPELAEKFPFCIPFDLFTMMSHFTANRSAPYIDVELDLGPAGVHHIELDFSVWDSVAALLRLLELIVFIAGLALAARRLIGAGGD